MQKLIPKSSVLSKKYYSLLTLIEYFEVDINCGKITYEGDQAQLKKVLFKFIEIYKQENPLEQIKGSNYAVLKELLDNTERKKHAELVNQLAIELKKKEDLIFNLQSNNRTVTNSSKLSIALTVFFGIIAIIQSL